MSKQFMEMIINDEKYFCSAPDTPDDMQVKLSCECDLFRATSRLHLSSLD